jgi:hypothetical protein
VRVDLDPLVEAQGGSGESVLFGEGVGGFVVAGPSQALRELAADGESMGVRVLAIGEAGGDAVELLAAEAEVSLPLADAEEAWRSLAGS